MRVIFVLKNENGETVTGLGSERDLDQSEVTALFAAGSVRISVETGNGSRSSRLVKVVGSQLDVFDSKPYLNIAVEELEESSAKTASAFYW
ncbi:hypothetical protein [Paenibacillus donghaensis]|uniref:Uncharacterized protein n=1 Tax=Paenibacillus donghaensis TaxID=414771 RepID=A0A2Z2K9F9_9BACL|nr:hypothetical protein [Paenibacillus donghaensis]ASA22104.1 hypothetical protein B9T62_15750 [Paenibacillus donghaensis]